MKTKEIIKMLEANGWVLYRIKGDHRIYKKEGEAMNICVPGALNKDIHKGTEQAILRDAKLK
ncbi:MAG: type II toxin-antitoxin system HicA family toxin [Prevotellaceae bacterium]|nr:type II toxin-antitoxin system HicA family toxin [Prevotellaceae bacterium]